MSNHLPDSRPLVQRGSIKVKGVEMSPIYCNNCGKDGGLVSAENMTFAFWLCDPCAEKWSPMVGTYTVPDEVFWQMVREEKGSLESLAKEKPDFNKIKMS
jgi:hypothetical protein